jgi:hypothetical protein
MVFTAQVASQVPVPITDDVYGLNYSWDVNWWRVNNHTYFVTADYPPFSGSSFSASTPFNGACGEYSGTMNLHTNTPYTLTVRPTCPNDRDDYVNGVTSLDLVIIQQHIDGIAPFTDGYRKLASDADDNNVINQDDIEHLRELILGTTNSLNRNSWEWLHPPYIAQWPVSFSQNPWSFTLNATSNPVGGFGVQTFTNLTTDEIFGNNQNLYFDYSTVKIGDLTSATANSWICGNPNYIVSNSFDSRARHFGQQNKKDDEFTVILEVFPHADILGYEIPLHISSNSFDLIDLKNDLDGVWYYNTELNRLTFCDLSFDSKPMEINHSLWVELKIKAKADISDIGKVMYLNPDGRYIEMVNTEVELSTYDVDFYIKEIIPAESRVKMYSYYQEIQINAESHQKDKLDFQLFSQTGELVMNRTYHVSQGINQISVNTDVPSGFYVGRVLLGHNSYTEKLVIIR